MTYAELNATSLHGIVEWVNTSADGYWGLSILLVIFCILLINQLIKGYETGSCFLSAGLITSLIAVPLRLGGLVTDLTFWTTIIVTFLAFFWVWVKK